MAGLTVWPPRFGATLGRNPQHNSSHVSSWLQHLPPTAPTSWFIHFPVVMYGCESWTVKKLSAEELMLLNCGVGEDS